jgi:hypothetical protein
VSSQNLSLFPDYDEISHYKLSEPQLQDWYFQKNEIIDSIFQNYGGKWVKEKIPTTIPNNIEKHLIKNG